MNRRAWIGTSLLATAATWLTGRLTPVSGSNAPAQPPRTEQDEFGLTPPDRSTTPRVENALPPESGFEYREFDISRYTTKIRHESASPQQAIVDWIVRRTGASRWFGERSTSLAVDRQLVRLYHDPRIIRQAADIIDRFNNALTDLLSIRLRLVAATDTQWRFAVFNRLKPLTVGPTGQQVWTLPIEEGIQILTQFQIDRGFRLLDDQKFEVVNGQPVTVKRVVNRNYVSGLQEAGPANFGVQAAVKAIEEGVTLKLDPLLQFDGDEVELAMDLRAVTVRSMIRTRVIAPRQVGTPEITLDVPETIESRMELNIPALPTDQMLFISAGILPGILQDRRGLANALGLGNTNTELLVFLEVKPIRTALSRSR